MYGDRTSGNGLHPSAWRSSDICAVTFNSVRTRSRSLTYNVRQTNSEMLNEVQVDYHGAVGSQETPDRAALQVVKERLSKKRARPCRRNCSGPRKRSV